MTRFLGWTCIAFAALAALGLSLPAAGYFAFWIGALITLATTPRRRKGASR